MTPAEFISYSATEPFLIVEAGETSTLSDGRIVEGTHSGYKLVDVSTAIPHVKQVAGGNSVHVQANPDFVIKATSLSGKLRPSSR